MTNHLLKSFLILPLIVFTSCLSDASKKNNQESADRNNGVTTLYLIRHAEKESGADPGLTRAGQARANAWVEYYFIKDIDHILSSDFKRTRQTAAPLAKAQNKEVEIYDVASMTGNKLLEDYRGSTVAVFGHSNTIHKYANDLQNEITFEELDESVYDKFIILRIDASGNAQAEWQTMDFMRD